MRIAFVALAGAAVLLSACGQPSDEPDNPPIDTSPTADTGTAAGANSFTEAQARGAIEGAGYTDVTGLTQNAQGVWVGQATKDGATGPVSVDYRGSVTAGTGQPTGDAGAAPAGGATPGEAPAAPAP